MSHAMVAGLVAILVLLLGAAAYAFGDMNARIEILSGLLEELKYIERLQEELKERMKAEKTKE